MNRNIKLLLSGLLLASAQVFAATTLQLPDYSHTKLFLPDYVPHAHSNFSRLKSVEKNDDAIGLTFGMSAFWEQILSGSRSGLELARGFSLTGETVGTVVVDQMLVAATAADSVTVTNTSLEHRRLGVNGSACYSLDNFYEGLWVAGNVAVLYERNRSNFTVAGTQATSYTNYLTGANIDGANQEALVALKQVSGRVASEVGVNNVDVMVGFRVVNNDNATVNIMGVAVAPTAFEHKREFLFQPNPGVRNFKLGAGACAAVKLVNDESYAINFNGDVQWRYGITRKGEKIVPQHNSVAGAHYKLVTNSVALSIARPLANVLADKVTVDVEHKNEFCAGASATFEKGGFGLAAGYRFHYAQEKTLVVNGLDSTANWKFVSTTFTPANQLTDTVNTAVITNASFYTTVPSQVQHCVSADLSYLFAEWEFPLLVGASGSYTFSHKRTNTPEYWGVGVRAGLSF